MGMRGVLLAGFSLLLLINTANGQSYMPADVKGVSGQHTLIGIEEVWNVVIRGVSASTRIIFRLEVYLYSSDGRLLYRGSSFALVQNAEVMQLDFTTISTYGPVRQEGVDPEWWKYVQASGGFIPPGTYRVEYRIVETDEKCIWTGIELVKTTSLFSVIEYYVIEPIYPLQGDTVCGDFDFLWSVAGRSGGNYELLIYQGRVNMQEVLMLEPLWRAGPISGFSYESSNLTFMNTSGWFSYAIRSEHGVYSSPVSFYYDPHCSRQDEGEGYSAYRSLWWHQLKLVDGLQQFTLRGDTLFLEWVQECAQKPVFEYTGSQRPQEISFLREGVWTRMILVVKADRLKVKAVICNRTYSQEWRFIRN